MRNPQVTVTLNPRLMLDLHLLHKSGLYGQSIAKVARNLIMSQVRDLVAAKVLPRAYEPEDAGRILEGAARNKRNTRRLSTGHKIARLP